MLAGISGEYYTRLERGSVGGVSEDVLERIASALRLDEAERAHLFDLIRTATGTSVGRRRPIQEGVRASIQRIVDAMTLPAYVRNGRLDILYANQLGAALYSNVYADPVRPANVARFIFLNRRATQFFQDWERIATDAVAILRAEAGRRPYDRRLSDLVGELSTRSEDFRFRWAAHDVKLHNTGTKTLHHPLVGELTLAYEGLEIATDPGQRILVYSAEPESPSHDALRLLATWTLAPKQAPVEEIDRASLRATRPSLIRSADAEDGTQASGTDR